MKKALSFKEVLELQIRNNKIKTLEDAFNENDPLLENNNSYLIKEDNSMYNKYQKGDIVFVKKYKYSDGLNGYNHLFIILEENYIVSMEYFCVLISSQLDKLKYESNELLLANKENNLNSDSIVKLDEIYRIKLEDISFKIGSVTEEQLNYYWKIYTEIYSKNN